MNKEYALGPLEHWARTNNLDNNIDETFGHLSPDEIVALAATYEESFADIFKLVRIGKTKSTFKLLYVMDAHYKVTLPDSLLADLKEHDVFWAVLGLRGDDWHLIYLSHHYSS